MVIIGENVTSIGQNVFRESFSLKIINIPDSVKTLGSSIIYSCSKLETVITIFYDCLAHTFAPTHAKGVYLQFDLHKHTFGVCLQLRIYVCAGRCCLLRVHSYCTLDLSQLLRQRFHHLLSEQQQSQCNNNFCICVSCSNFHFISCCLCHSSQISYWWKGIIQL